MKLLVDLYATSLRVHHAENRPPPSGELPETELGATQLHLRRTGQVAALVGRAAVLGGCYCFVMS